jgi:hypothetical protein
MNTNLHATVVKVTTRTAPALTADSSPTDFVSLVVFDGNDTVYLWAYATDFPVLPVVGDTGTFNVTVRAKAVPDSPARPRLSIRANSFVVSLG